MDNHVCHLKFMFRTLIMYFDPETLKLLDYILNKSNTVSNWIENIIIHGMLIRYARYSVNYMMKEFNILSISCNNMTYTMDRNMEIYLMYIGWNIMDKYCNDKYKDMHVLHRDCFDTIILSPEINLVSIYQVLFGKKTK